MTTRKSKRAPSGAPATKWFITAASVAAVIGGWVGLASQPADGLDPAAQILATDLGLAPIPTVVPAPTGRRSSLQTETQVTTSQVTTSQSSLPTLRSVTAPSSRPAPITVTRSSR